jgi:hypothetical protein
MMTATPATESAQTPTAKNIAKHGKSAAVITEKVVAKARIRGVRNALMAQSAASAARLSTQKMVTLKTLTA